VTAAGTVPATRPPVSAGLAAGGCGAVAGQAQIRSSTSDSEPPSATCQPASTSVVERGWAVVAPGDLPYVTRALAEAITGHGNHGGRTPVTAAYARILGLLAGQVPATVRQLSAGAASVAGTGPLGDVAAAVNGLDGSERKLLLGHLAGTRPDVAAAGLAWLAEYHAANAERERIRRRERKREQRRRRRADGRAG
jgi:hypothetical protein